MKGMLFGGCSFTWGQGLWYYSDLNDLFYPKYINKFDFNTVTTAHVKVMESLRFSRLVANYFNTFDVQKLQNGGSEDTTFNFFDQIFHGGSNTHLTNEKMKFSDFDYIILQTSQLYRNRFHFTLDGEEQWAIVWTNANGINIENFYKWLKINNITIEEWLDMFVKSQVNRIKAKFEYYESQGVKTKLICWEDDYLPYIEKDEFLSKRHVPLYYMDSKYDSIFSLLTKKRYLEIQNDYDNFTNPPLDGHPSKKCHEIIAESIIKHIKENDEIVKSELPRKTPRHTVDKDNNSIITYESPEPDNIQMEVYPEFLKPTAQLVKEALYNSVPQSKPKTII